MKIFVFSHLSKKKFDHSAHEDGDLLNFVLLRVLFKTKIMIKNFCNDISAISFPRFVCLLIIFFS